MSNFRYTAAHEIFKLFEGFGWIITGLGALFAFAGFATGNFPFLPEIAEPTLINRLVAAIPGLLFLEGGLIHVALVKVGQANVDTAEMTRELLNLARKDQSRKASPIAAQRQPNTPRKIATKQPETRPTKEGEQVLVENYKTIPIYQRHTGHYVGEKWFAGVKQARAHIDDLAAN